MQYKTRQSKTTHDKTREDDIIQYKTISNNTS